MTYVEKKAMKIMGEMAYNYGNQPEVVETIRQIIADTKFVCIDVVSFVLAYHPRLSNRCVAAIDQVEVKGE